MSEAERCPARNVARSYALSMLLLFALASLHGRRFVNPLAYGGVLLLLLNTNVLMRLNSVGLRDKVSPLVGVEYAF